MGQIFPPSPNMSFSSPLLSGQQLSRMSLVIYLLRNFYYKACVPPCYCQILCRLVPKSGAVLSEDLTYHMCSLGNWHLGNFKLKQKSNLFNGERLKNIIQKFLQTCVEESMQGLGILVIAGQGRYAGVTRQSRGRSQRYNNAWPPFYLHLIQRNAGSGTRKKYHSLTLVLYNGGSINNKAYMLSKII